MASLYADIIPKSLRFSNVDSLFFYDIIRSGDWMKKNFKLTIIAGYFGYITQAIVNNLAPLLFLIFRDTFGMSLSKITMLITVNFCVQLVVDYSATKFVDKIGYRAGIVGAHIFSAAGLICLGVLPKIMDDSYAGLLISVVLYALGGGLIEVLISPIVEACPTDNKAAAMSLLHSFYCWGTVAVVAVSTLFLHFFGKNSWQLLAVLWAVVPVLNGILFSVVPINTLTEENEGMKNRELMKSGLFWLFVLLMVTAGASEQAMSQWASAFAESGLNVSKTVGDLLGPCLFSMLMGTSRVVSSKLSKKTDVTTLMIIGGVLCVVSYLLASLTHSAVFGLVGCALCGLSVGVMWPGAFSLASRSFKRGGTALFALLALAGDMGCTLGPTLVGELSDGAKNGLKSGLLISIVFPILLIVACAYLKKKEKNK